MLIDIKLMIEALIEVMREEYSAKKVPFVDSYIETITAARYTMMLDITISTDVSWKY